MLRPRGTPAPGHSGTQEQPPPLRPEKMTSSPLRAFVAAACLGAVSTVGDWIWARWIPDGAVVPGIVHGLLFFVALAVVLGWAGGVQDSTRSLLATLPVAGLALAALFYPVAAAIGYLGSLLVTWAGMWLTLAWLLRRALHDRESGVRTLGRAAIAMIGSGLALLGRLRRVDPACRRDRLRAPVRLLDDRFPSRTARPPGRPRPAKSLTNPGAHREICAAGSRRAAPRTPDQGGSALGELSRVGPGLPRRTRTTSRGGRSCRKAR